MCNNIGNINSTIVYTTEHNMKWVNLIYTNKIMKYNNQISYIKIKNKLKKESSSIIYHTIKQ